MSNTLPTILSEAPRYPSISPAVHNSVHFTLCGPAIGRHCAAKCVLRSPRSFNPWSSTQRGSKLRTGVRAPRLFSMRQNEEKRLLRTGSSFITTCRCCVAMSSLLWSATQKELAHKAAKCVAKGGNARTVKEMSKRSFVASRRSVADKLASQAFKRSYATLNRGQEVANSFEEWINAIPQKERQVRLC